MTQRHLNGIGFLQYSDLDMLVGVLIQVFTFMVVLIMNLQLFRQMLSLNLMHFRFLNPLQTSLIRSLLTQESKPLLALNPLHQQLEAHLLTNLRPLLEELQ